MTELVFKGKEFVWNHHLAVPFRPLVPHAEKGIGPPRLDGNLIIRGDNLHALKALLPTHAGKVDVIFIDPPYNTGNEGWAYNDNVNAPMIKEWLDSNPIGIEDGLRHDKWCAMMWPRLRLLHELLAEDGSLWMTIDYNEFHRACFLLHEIFGEDNLLSVITTEANPRGRQSDTYLATVNDFLICAAKDKSRLKLQGVVASEDYVAEFRFSDEHGHKWRELGLRQRGADSLRTDREDMFFPIYVCPSDGSVSLEQTARHNVKVLPR
jgi:adenine-specific DNA-methyltransferase